MSVWLVETIVASFAYFFCMLWRTLTVAWCVLRLWGKGFHMWRVDVNMLNKLSHTADKMPLPSPSMHVMKCSTGPWTWMEEFFHNTVQAHMLRSDLILHRHTWLIISGDFARSTVFGYILTVIEDLKSRDSNNECGPTQKGYPCLRIAETSSSIDTYLLRAVLENMLPQRFEHDSTLTRLGIWICFANLHARFYYWFLWFGVIFRRL